MRTSWSDNMLASLDNLTDKWLTLGVGQMMLISGIIANCGLGLILAVEFFPVELFGVALLIGSLFNLLFSLATLGMESS